MADGKPAQPNLQHSNWDAEFLLRFDNMCQQYWRGWEEWRKPPMMPAPMELPPDRALELQCPPPELETQKVQAPTRSPHSEKQNSRPGLRSPPTGTVREAYGHGKQDPANNMGCGDAEWRGNMGGENSMLSLPALGLTITGIG
ncbi:Hypothetical predicted protein [Pelobates cultripes]|uniref:Uncharacterized protein n=1 Tax=Pelobates cultripes TaxID=61616 RepID=A0AAD1WHN0_PELCU|nr:Hypothetical predicted protein [Pelobates cultripes]